MLFLYLHLLLLNSKWTFVPLLYAQVRREDWTLLLTPHSVLLRSKLALLVRFVQRTWHNTGFYIILILSSVLLTIHILYHPRSLSASDFSKEKMTHLKWFLADPLLCWRYMCPLTFHPHNHINWTFWAAQAIFQLVKGILLSLSLTVNGLKYTSFLPANFSSAFLFIKLLQLKQDSPC